MSVHLPMYSIRSFYLKNEGQERDDLDENDQANVSCEHAYVRTSRSRRLIVVHNRTFREERTDKRTDERTNELTNILPAGKHDKPFHSVGTVTKY